jgi:hypothetical protein
VNSIKLGINFFFLVSIAQQNQGLALLAAVDTLFATNLSKACLLLAVSGVASPTGTCKMSGGWNTSEFAVPFLFFWP